MNEIEKVLQKLRDTKALEFGVGALKKVPSMFEKFFPGKTAVVVADKITYDIAVKLSIIVLGMQESVRSRHSFSRTLVFMPNGHTWNSWNLI